MSNNTPTQEQVRAARRAGFDNSVSHMAPDRKNRLSTAHAKQDARREANVTAFVKNVRGAK